MYLKRKHMFCLIEGLCLCPWIPQSLHPLTFCNQHSILFLWSQLSQILHFKGNIYLSFYVLAFLFSDSIHVIMSDNLSLYKDRIVFHCVFIYHIFFTCPLTGDGLVDFRTRLSWTMLQGPQASSMWSCWPSWTTAQKQGCWIFCWFHFSRHLHKVFHKDYFNL